MAREYGLNDDWLNSSAKAFIPQGATWVEIHIGEQSDVSVAAPETLLAMKLSAARTRDMPDISRLVSRLRLRSPGEAVVIAAEQYGDDDVAYSPDSREDALLVAEEAIRMAASTRPPGVLRRGVVRLGIAIVRDDRVSGLCGIFVRLLASNHVDNLIKDLAR